MNRYRTLLGVYHRGGALSASRYEPADQSQEFISSAQKRIEEQGGVVNVARNEFSRVEKEIEKAATPRNATGEQAQPSFEAFSNNVWNSLQGLAHIPQVQQLRDQIAHGMPHTADAQRAIASLPAFQDVEALASRYLEAGEELAKDIGRDIKATLDGIVSVAPSEQENASTAQHFGDLGQQLNSAHYSSVFDADDGEEAKHNTTAPRESAPAFAPAPAPQAEMAPAPAPVPYTEPGPVRADDDFTWDDDEYGVEKPSTAHMPSADTTTAKEYDSDW